MNKSRLLIIILIQVVVVGSLFILSEYNYSIFHLTMETLMIIIGLSIFILGYLTRKIKKDNFLFNISFSMFITAIILFIHALTYKGMNLIPGYDSNLPTQLWIIAGYIHALTLITGILLYDKKVKQYVVISAYIILSSILVLLAFAGIFPDCFIENSGLTIFKKVSEYLIIILFGTSFYYLCRIRDRFLRRFFIMFSLAIMSFILAHFVFTLYTDVFGFNNFLGHIFNLNGYILMYIALLHVNISIPLEEKHIDLSKQIIDLEKSIKEVTKSEQIFKSLYDNSPVGYQSLDINGNFISVNDSYLDLLGYKREEIIGKNFRDFMSADSMNKMSDTFKGFLDSGEVDVIFDMIHKEKHIVPIRFLGKISYDENGEFKQTHCILSDFTKILNYQKSLEDSEKNLKKAVESLNHFQKLMKYTIDHTKSGISVHDKNLNYLFVSESYLEQNKVKEEDIIGKHPYDVFPFFPQKWKDLNKRTLLGEVISEDKDLYIDEFGVKQWTRWETRPWFEKDATIGGIIVYTENITKEVELLENLKNSEKNYKLLGDMLPLSMVHYQIIQNFENNKIEFVILGVNKELELLIGMGSNELVGKNIWDVFPQTEQYWIEHYESVAITGKTAIFEDYSAAIDKYMRVIAYKIDSDKMAVVMEDVTESRKKQNEILHISYHDSLTDLYNRRYHEENLSKLDIPENYPLTIVMSDINGLKLINDAFGHKSGDKLLCKAADVITNSCRETDCIARIGGDEFIIVMPNTSGEEAEIVIKEINNAAKRIKIESIELSISFGFATKNNINEDIQETLRTAEDVMYREKLIKIPSMRSGAIETILNALYEKDENSEIHSRAVSDISEKIAISCGMDRQEINEVKTAGLLHDIGKIVIPIQIIVKEGKLTVEEYDLIKSHPEIGFRILNSTHDMRSISNIVLSHHERWDGLGYPRGIKAEDIPIQSRIISIADAFDAMTSERTYREVFTNKVALDEIIKNAGTQFDPQLVKVFEEHFSEIIVN